jgi:DNA-binding transcriptional ArsR family regulator
MTVPAGFKGLRFPCECVSSRPGGYSEPWAPIAKNRLLPDGTKEEILNVLARGPNTITQIAETLGLSAPSVHTHISAMLRSELLREAVQWQKTHPAERYYEPNFPVINEDQAEELCRLCDDLSAEVSAIIKKNRPKLEKAFQTTALLEKGWSFEDVAQFVFASVQRSARKRLEDEGMLNAAKAHRNGIDWIFWAEEPATNRKKPR